MKIKEFKKEIDELFERFSKNYVEIEEYYELEIKEKTGSYFIEVEKAVHDHGIKFNEINITKGWRLPTVTEAIHISNNLYEHLKLTSEANDFWIEQFFDINTYNARAGFLGYYIDEFRINWDNDMSNGGRSRGVLLVRDKK